jgi:hypothetical protein
MITMARPKIPAPKIHLPWVVASRRRRGRPAMADDARKRELHIECAGMMLCTSWPVKRVAASLGISRDTAYRWYRLALSYPGARSEALRQLAKKKKR